MYHVINSHTDGWVVGWTDAEGDFHPMSKHSDAREADAVATQMNADRRKPIGKFKVSLLSKTSSGVRMFSEEVQADTEEEALGKAIKKSKFMNLTAWDITLPE